MSDIVVRLSEVHVRRGDRPVLEGVSLQIRRGEIVALMGASGSGKTTLLRLLAGLERFDRGTIDVDGVDVPSGGGNRSLHRALSRKVGMVFQFHCLFEHLTALENVRLAPMHVHRVRADLAESQAIDLLRQLGVEHRARALPRELSGGEAQRVAIARALATDPPVLLLDEPTASLDTVRRTELSAILRSLVQRGRSLLVATHDDEFVRTVASRVVRMEGAGKGAGGAR